MHNISNCDGRFWISSTIAMSVVVTSMILTACSSSNPDTAQQNSYVFKHPANDHELTIASQEARYNWPIFYHAFLQRDQHSGKQFQVKVQVPAGDKTEHFWVDVDSIKDGIIKGRYDSDGVAVTKIRQGQPTTIDISDITDWAIEDGPLRKGNYSLKVIAKSGIAELNNLNLPPAECTASKTKLSAHWSDLARELKKTGKANLTEADVQTATVVQSLDCSIKGNTGKEPAAHELATLCQLPDDIIGSMRYVYNHK